jgi:hypothetical protein
VLLPNLFEVYSVNNKAHLLATLICSGAIVASVNVIAQNINQDQQRQRSETSGAASGQTESAGSAFERLDSSKRGYLTNSDVSSMQGFDSSCDKDNDGRISRDEFSPCWSTWSRAQSGMPDTTGSGASGSGSSGSGSGSSSPGSSSPGTNPGSGSPGVNTPVSPGVNTPPVPSAPGSDSGSSGSGSSGSGAGSSGGSSSPGAGSGTGSSGTGSGSGSGSGSGP